MKPKEYEKEAQLIHAGLKAAARVIDARTQQLKKEAPGLPIDSLRFEATRGADLSTAALAIVAEWKRLAEAAA
jgi:hypothetical protein